MITDTRRIQFSPEAIREAVKLYRTLFPQKQPPGLLGNIFIRASSPVVLGVTVQATGASTFREIEMGESEVAAMLIIYCRKMRVPLPRTAEKSIVAVGHSLVLEVTKSVPIDLAAA